MVAPYPTRVPVEAVAPPVRRPVVATCRALLAAAAAAGVALAVATGPPLEALSRLTVQSNILLALVTAVSAARAWRPRRPVRPPLTGAALLYVLLAAITSWAATGPSLSLLATATPLAALLDWLLFTRPRTLRVRMTPAWLLYPAAYLAFTLLKPGRHLYPYLNPDTLPTTTLAGHSALLAATTTALALLLTATDHLRPTL
ncbi:Pr6Pr family membrane protein [Streptomyces sp. NPDC049954]|uniref:Pr6Pr family membrane protein n=1 Tax=Streptomyces sp. NPDC049954 TaxID=3155779 RepID=UPI0034304D9E